MRLAPELRFLERIKWQVFVTLTFRGRVPRPVWRERLLHAWLSDVSGMARVPYDRLDWVVRDEMGERLGRPHFHVLIGRIPSSMLSPALLYRCRFAWAGVGFSDLRMWLEGLGALEYIGEDGGNCYEAGKFCYATGLLLSESLLDMASTGDRNSESGWRVGKYEYPLEHLDLASVNAGCDQRSTPSLRGACLPRWGYSVIAANASDQGVEVFFGGGDHRRI